MHDTILLLTGIIVGAMNAIAGGGMLVGFPIMVALGLPPIVASATSSIVTIPGQLASAWVYLPAIKRAPKKFIWLALPLIAGALVGAIVLQNTSADDFAMLVPWLVLFGVGLFTLQPYISTHMHRHLSGTKKSAHRTPFWMLALFLLPMSFYAGYFGAGVGFMMLAFLSFTRIHDMHTMTGLKNIGATVMATTTAFCLSSSGLINWHTGILMAIGGIIGGYGGARLSQKIPSRWLRVIVIVIGFSSVLYLLFKHY